MALEKWLLDLAEFTEEKTICQFCEYLLRKSASAAITAVVLSVVIAYPDKLFPISWKRERHSCMPHLTRQPRASIPGRRYISLRTIGATFEGVRLVARRCPRTE